MELNFNYEQMLQLILNRRVIETPKLMSIQLSKCPDMEEQAKELPEDLMSMFNSIFTKEAPVQINLRTILPFKQHKTPMPVCNRLLSPNEQVYRCYNCSTHESAVLCVRCFERGNHQGHRFSKSESGGGNCDCGNPDAIDEAGFCVDHKGKAEEMIIDEQEEQFFNRYILQIFIWVLRLYQLGMKTQTELLLTHLLETLDWLNNESLYFNTLTNKLLFSGENQMIDHILILGSVSKDNPIARKATELFLKMFSLEIFKENLAIAYLRAYNRLDSFENTKFESLFIQLFANNDLVERVIEKSKISLDPREREYSLSNYYTSLGFMGTIKQRAARAFFTPIIHNGGVHCKISQDIERQCEEGKKPLQEFYSERMAEYENSYYSINKILAKLIKDTPELMEIELRNQYKLIMKLHFKKNKIVLIHQRLFAMLSFVYFKFDYEKIDPFKLAQILEIQPSDMKEFLKKLTRCLFYCLKEFSMCIGNSGFGLHSFENYVDLYCRSANGNKIILLDMIGIKFCAVALDRIKDSQNFSRIITEILNEEASKESLLANSFGSSDEEEEQEPPKDEPKSKQSAVLFYLGWINTISIIIESIIYDRSEIILANELEVNDIPILTEMYDKQFKKLILNVKEISMHEMEAMGVYWFAKPIDKAVIAKYAYFDKIKKRFVVKENVQGIPIKRELLKSFAKTPDHFMRRSDELAIEITDNIRRLRDIIFPVFFVQRLYKSLISHLRSALTKEFQKYVKQLANHLKMVNMLFQSNNQSLEDIIDVMISLVQDNEKLKTQISTIMQTDKKQNAEQQQDKEKMDKRKQLLRKKKQEKLKNFKNKQNIEKFLTQNEQQEVENTNNTSQCCIICHENTSVKPLYYLASTYLSNIAYCILKVEGINPYFLSCFHHVHFDCFISIVKEHERTLCPLCKAITNIIIPTEQNIDNEAILSTCVERMEILYVLSYKKEVKNIYIWIMKSFIQFFFSGAIEEGLITQKQIRLYRIVFGMCQQHYKKISEQEQVKFIDQLKESSTKYQKSSNEHYNFGLLIDFVFNIAQKRFKEQQITEQVLQQIIVHCKDLPKNDLMKCIVLAQKVFDLNCNIILQNLEKISEVENKQLKTYVFTFDPPKTIKALLQERKQIQNENICKMGHNICICLICSWKGCLDCNQCFHHTNKVHNFDAFYFNFITGGFYHQYYGETINIRSLYVNDLGLYWKPRYEDDAYFFEIDIYQKMVQALKSGCLMQMIRNNYEYLKVPDYSIWTL